VSTAAAQWVLPWIAFVTTLLVLTPSTYALHGAVRHRLAAIAPRERSTLLTALAVMPASVAALVAVLGFMPSLGGWIVDPHCHAETGCGPHVPHLHAGAPYALSLGVALLGAAAALWSSIVGRLRRTQRLASALGSMAEPSPRDRFETVDSPEAFAYCVGLWRPKVVVSTGLIRRLRPEQLRAVVAHEQEHALRRDNLRHALASACSLPLGSRGRRKLLADLTSASEEACDRTAAARTNSETVLAALAALAPAKRAPRMGTTFDSSASLATRTEALSRPPASGQTATAVAAAIVLAYAVGTLGTTYVAHHGAEWLLDWLG
jgi:Zn-dependent protease with chaperone function